MSLDTQVGLSYAEKNAEVVRRLEATFGEITDNILSTIPTLPMNVKDAILAAEGDEGVEKVWNEYLQSVLSVMPKGPNPGEVDQFQRAHGHRYTRATAELLGAN